jgi:hypothetical protein
MYASLHATSQTRATLRNATRQREAIDKAESLTTMLLPAKGEAIAFLQEIARGRFEDLARGYEVAEAAEVAGSKDSAT